MVEASEERFRQIVADAIDAIPKKYAKRLDGMAFIVEDQPTQEQAIKLKLGKNSLLFGLYEGVPLPARNTVTKLLPDKITLFRGPLSLISRSEEELIENVRHTLWHELAHYFGLDHDRIHELER